MADCCDKPDLEEDSGIKSDLDSDSYFDEVSGVSSRLGSDDVSSRLGSENDYSDFGSDVDASAMLFYDKQEALEAIDERGGFVLGCLCEDLRADKEVVLAAVTKNGLCLEHASDQLKSDPEVVFVAVGERSSLEALSFASEEVRDNKEFMMAILGQYSGVALKYASKELRADKEVVLEAVEENGEALQFANDILQSDREVVLAAVAQSGNALCYAEKSVQDDDEIVRASLAQYGDMLQFASKRLRDDKDFMLDIVARYGATLAFASDRLKNDKDVVLAAVENCGTALKDASDGLKRDKEVVMQAVENMGALEFADDSLKADKEVVLKAVSSDHEMLKFALGGLSQDRDCWIAAGLWSDEQEQKKKLTDVEKVPLSTKFSLSKESASAVTGFTKALNEHPYFRNGNFDIFSPNFFMKSTCDPEWTSMSWPCRGTFDTCEKPASLKVGKPQPACCWRYTFRWQLEQARRTKGFMIQIVDIEGQPSYIEEKPSDYELGDGQKIETVMANEVGTKIFRIYRPSGKILGGAGQYVLDFQPVHVDGLVANVRQWYDGNREDMSECEVMID